MLKPSIAKNFEKAMETPAGRRGLAWDMTGPIRPLRFPRPWDGFPHSPKGTMDVWKEKIVKGEVR